MKKRYTPTSGSLSGTGEYHFREGGLQKMKIFALSSMLLLIGCSGTNSGAADTPAPQTPVAQLDPPTALPAQRDTSAEDCKPYAQLARSIMESRQGGVPMTEVMEILNDNDASASSQRLVMQAYEQPGYSTEEHQMRTVTEFENTAYLECMKGLVRRY